MRPLNDLLRDADPLRHEPAVPDEDVRRMRRAMLSEPQQVTGPRWPGAIIVAGALAVTAMLVGDRWPVARSSVHDRPAELMPETTVAPQNPPARRQLQFATPGGTRVIWVFNSDFDVR